LFNNGRFWVFALLRLVLAASGFVLHPSELLSRGWIQRVWHGENTPQHKAEQVFQTVPPVTPFSSLKSFTFRLWDEDRHRLVGFSRL